jgi:hypothetical protein
MTENEEEDQTNIIVSCPKCDKEIGYDDNCPCGFDDEFNGRAPSEG